MNDEKFRDDEFDKIFREWRGCSRCPLCSEDDPVIGDGNVAATYLFVFERPVEAGVGNGYLTAGEFDFFQDLLYGAGIRISDTFSTSIVAAPTPEGRSPRKEEFLPCLPRLESTIYAVDPRIIIPVGKFAMTRLLGGKWSNMEQCTGALGTVTIQGKLTRIVYDATPIYDPGLLLRSDQRDPHTGEWPTNGKVSRTLRALTTARDVVQFTRAKAQQERSKHADVPAKKERKTETS